MSIVSVPVKFTASFWQVCLCICCLLNLISGHSTCVSKCSYPYFPAIVCLLSDLQRQFSSLLLLEVLRVRRPSHLPLHHPALHLCQVLCVHQHYTAPPVTCFTLLLTLLHQLGFTLYKLFIFAPSVFLCGAF